MGNKGKDIYKYDRCMSKANKNSNDNGIFISFVFHLTLLNSHEKAMNPVYEDRSIRIISIINMRKTPLLFYIRK